MTTRSDVSTPRTSETQAQATTGIVTLLKGAYAIFSEKKAASHGAAIAFYTVTSIAPVVLIVIAVAGFVLGDEAARGAILAEFQSLLGPEGADFLQRSIASASDPRAGTVASLIGIATLILAASGVFLELRDSLNEIWDTRQDSGISTMLRARLGSLGLVLAMGFVLLVSLVIDAALSGFRNVINASLPFGAAILMGINFVVSLALISMIFAAIFKLLPSRSLAWRDVIFGAVVTGLLFQAGKVLIGLYLGTKTGDSSLGAAGALIALLFWVYYSAQIILFGASLARARYLSLHPDESRAPNAESRSGGTFKAHRESVSVRPGVPRAVAHGAYARDMARNPAMDSQGPILRPATFENLRIVILGGGLLAMRWLVRGRRTKD
jgi:membrane protein